MPTTREERQSTISFLMPFQPRGVDPDPGIDQAERQAAALVYAGIAAEEPQEDEGGDFLDAINTINRIQTVLR